MSIHFQFCIASGIATLAAMLITTLVPLGRFYISLLLHCIAFTSHCFYISLTHTIEVSEFLLRGKNTNLLICFWKNASKRGVFGLLKFLLLGPYRHFAYYLCRPSLVHWRRDSHKGYPFLIRLLFSPSSEACSILFCCRLHQPSFC